MSVGANSLGGIIAANAELYPERPALFVDGTTYTYRELLDRALLLAALISQIDGGDFSLCAVYAKRSLWTYAGILGTLMAGRGYVPLNPSFPVERTRKMLDLAGATTVVADGHNLDSLEKIIAKSNQKLTVILPDSSSQPVWAKDYPQHRILCASDLCRHDIAFTPRMPGEDAIAYLLFTSGTTGTPKGIGIQQRNVLSYIKAIAQRYDIGPQDRFSQNFETTFDLSVHDMFVCWSRGACLCAPSERVAMAPAKFIRDHELTCWFSTPSTAAIMARLSMLRPNAFPSLRWSLFCGEPLTAHIAAAWQQAAPKSTVENLYGPTEATIACTAYTYSVETSPDECVNGLIPIGRPFGQTSIAVVNGEGKPIGNGEIGELLLGGGQIAPGYWRDAERTSASFQSLPSLQTSNRWYRTGDLVSINSQQNLIYQGRVDHQIKIMGHRVELQEVEAIVREASNADIAVALGWPRTPAGADGIIVYVSGSTEADAAILQRCRQELPPYMVPTEIHRIESMPLNANQKTDRAQLLEMRKRLS